MLICKLEKVLPCRSASMEPTKLLHCGTTGGCRLCVDEMLLLQVWGGGGSPVLADESNGNEAVKAGTCCHIVKLVLFLLFSD